MASFQVDWLTVRIIGPHSVFESPVKPSSKDRATSSAGGVPAPPSGSFAFAPPSPVKRFLGAHGASFTTPRKTDPDPDCSSPDTPNQADAEEEEDTPEQSSRTETALVKYVDPESPTATEQDTEDATARPGSDGNHRRPTIFGGFGALPSPGRGELRRGRLADVTTRKVRKRRRQDHHSRDAAARVAYHRAPQQSGSDDDHDDQRTVVDHRHGGYEYHQPQPQPRPSPAAPNHPLAAAAEAAAARPSESLIPSVLAWLESHPQLPHVLSFYAQLLLNFFLVFFVMYIIYSFWATVRGDVDRQSEAVAAETLAEMAGCAQQFVANRCERAQRVPAMEAVCDGWERCMNKDPNAVGRARVSAHTFAEIFNSFVEPISYKAMVSF